LQRHWVDGVGGYASPPTRMIAAIVSATCAVIIVMHKYGYL